MDRLQFGILVAFVAELTREGRLTKDDIGRLEDLTHVSDVPPLMVPMVNEYVTDKQRDIIDHLLCCLATNRKIEAIKTHRTLTGFGLKDSKDYIENLIAKYTILKRA